MKQSATMQETREEVPLMDPEEVREDGQGEIAGEAGSETGAELEKDIPGLAELTEGAEILLPLTGEALTLRREVRALTKKIRATMRLARPLVDFPFPGGTAQLNMARINMIAEDFETFNPDISALIQKLAEFRKEAKKGMKMYRSIGQHKLRDLVLKDTDGTIHEATDIIRVFRRVHGKLEATVDVMADLGKAVRLWATSRLRQI
jgi:hypothetical protein